MKEILSFHTHPPHGLILASQKQIKISVVVSALMLSTSLFCAESITWNDDSLVADLKTISGVQNSLGPSELDRFTSGNAIVVDTLTNPINGALFGAFHGDKELSGNTVTIQNGNIGQNAYGARSDQGAVKNNRLSITGDKSSVGSLAYAGYSQNGEATGNTLMVMITQT